jgi:hypothetical protein
VLNAVDFGDLLLHVIDHLPDPTTDVLARVPALVPLHPGRRIPGHQRVRSICGCACWRRAPQHLLRRRRRPVDLWLARRRGRQHPALREGFPRRHRDPAGAATTAPPHILGAASGVIAQTRAGWARRCGPRRPGRREGAVIGHWDGEEEARWIGEEIEAAAAGRAGMARSPDEMAILVRASTRCAPSRTASSPSACPTA